jgi:CheY-like chemotaxis protein
MVRRSTDSRRSRIVATARVVALVERCYNGPAVRILLVDDDPSATRLYRTMLVNDGHEVVVHDSGVDAVEAAERERFDLVITDFNMPGIKGDVTLSLLRARLPELPVIIVTSEPSPVVEKRARDAGAAAFLRKPCGADVLARTVARVCKKPNAVTR